MLSYGRMRSLLFVSTPTKRRNLIDTEHLYFLPAIPGIQMKYKENQLIAKSICQFALPTIRKSTFCFIVSNYWRIRSMRS